MPPCALSREVPHEQEFPNSPETSNHSLITNQEWLVSKDGIQMMQHDVLPLLSPDTGNVVLHLFVFGFNAADIALMGGKF